METTEVQTTGNDTEAVLPSVRRSLSKFRHGLSVEVIQKAPYPGYRSRDQSLCAFYKAFDAALKKRMNLVMAQMVRAITLKAEEEENTIGVDIRQCRNVDSQ